MWRDIVPAALPVSQNCPHMHGLQSRPCYGCADIVGDCYIVVAGLIKEDQDGFVCVDEIDEEQVHVWES